MPKGIPKNGKRKKGGGRKSLGLTKDQVEMMVHRKDKERIKAIKGSYTIKDFVTKLIDNYLNKISKPGIL